MNATTTLNNGAYKTYRHKDTVLETIDVAEEYRQVGLQIVASGVQQGWVPCRVWGKDDHNPSAQICLSGDSIGQYVDFSGGIAFGLKHIVWTLAIEINLRRAPDANRFIELKLKRPNPGENRLNVPSDDKLRKLGEKLLTALVYYARSIQIEAKRLVGLTFPGRNSRDVATFIAPAAVVNCLLQTDGALSQMIAYNENKDVLPDQNDLLQTILTTRVTFQSDIHTDGTYTIR